LLDFNIILQLCLLDGEFNAVLSHHVIFRALKIDSKSDFNQYNETVACVNMRTTLPIMRQFTNID